MTAGSLEGTELPSGEHTVEGWKAFLWTEATGNDLEAFRDHEADVADQLIPPTMALRIVWAASEDVDATMRRISEDWTTRGALGGLRIRFHKPLRSGEPIHVHGLIRNVEHKDGSSGDMTIVTYAYEATTRDGVSVFELEADMIVMGEG